MGKTRLEAFSDGVIAIIITIMVLEIKVPHGAQWTDLSPLIPAFLSYTLSFIYVGIYWANHHHLVHLVKQVTAGVMWSNAHLLFWLSLVPFATGWAGENHFAPIPVLVYGSVLFMSGLAFNLLVRAIRLANGQSHLLDQSTQLSDYKGNFSLLMYALAIVSTFWSAWIAIAIYVVVAIMWIVPSKQIEDYLSKQQHGS